MAFRYLLPALAIVGSAAAACSGTTTISSSADAAALSTCLTYTGDIAIATSNPDDIALNGIRRIRGSLTANVNHKMTSLSADSLSQIDDNFMLKELTVLTTLSFPMLTAVNTVNWNGIPSLGGIMFTAGLTQVANLKIQNTQLGSLDGINLVEVDSLFLANNFYLNDISMPIGNVSTGLVLSANGDQVIADFPNLEWATNMRLSGCSTVNLPSLSAVNGSLGFYSGEFSSLSLANLTTVGGTLAFVSNDQLTNVSAPSLKSINGGLLIANNTMLTSVTGFPRVESITGAVDMTGVFKTVTLPSLKNVRGGFNIQSKNDISSSCAKFKPLSGGRASVIKGPFNCKQTAKPKGIHGGSGTGTGSGAASSSSSGSANAIYISGATGVMGVVAAIFGML